MDNKSRIIKYLVTLVIALSIVITAYQTLIKQDIIITEEPIEANLDQ